jgi:hypothetical protein
VVDHEPTHQGRVTSFSLGAARPPNKELKLTKPGKLRSFAAQFQVQPAVERAL